MALHLNWVQFIVIAFNANVFVYVQYLETFNNTVGVWG